MKTVWHNYTEWEDYINGMYSTLDTKEKSEMRTLALKIMIDHHLFYLCMKRAAYEWPVSCEHNFTNTASNRRSWIGQAALAIEIGCPEDLTRKCWSELTNKQRLLANKAADKIIFAWENSYAKKNIQLHIYMGKSGLQARNTGRSRPEARGHGVSPIVSSNMQGHINERFSPDVIGF